jgi:hypothetical protein
MTPNPAIVAASLLHHPHPHTKQTAVESEYSRRLGAPPREGVDEVALAKKRMQRVVLDMIQAPGDPGATKYARYEPGIPVLLYISCVCADLTPSSPPTHTQQTYTNEKKDKQTREAPESPRPERGFPRDRQVRRLVAASMPTAFPKLFELLVFAY